jgi:hypothetical protein
MGENFCKPLTLQVSFGLSTLTVFAPIRTASISDLKTCTILFESLFVILLLSFSLNAILESKEQPIFKVTLGLL